MTDKQIWELRGEVISKQEVRQYRGELKGQSYYKLNVKLTAATKPAVFLGYIQAYRRDILDDEIWNDILESNYINKKYLFFCYKHVHNYQLMKWRESGSK